MTRLMAAMTPAERFAMATEMTDFAIDQSLAALAAAMPGAIQQETHLRWCELHYGRELTDRLRAYLREREAQRGAHEASPHYS